MLGCPILCGLGDFCSMKLNWVKILVFILIIAFYASLLAHTIQLPFGKDLPRQIKIGEQVLQGNWGILYKNTFSYTEPDQKFYNHHWLSGAVFYLVHQAVGWSGFTVFKIIILLSAFSLLFKIALKKADFWLVALVSLPVIFLLNSRTDPRPEIFSYLLIAIYLYLLADLDEHPERNRIFWLIPLQFLWVNLHVFFSVGIMLVAGFLVEKVALNYKDLKSNPLIKKLAALLLVLVLVSFINPRGAEGVFYSYPGQDFPIPIDEFQSRAGFLRGVALSGYVYFAAFPLLAILLGLSFIIGFRKDKKPIFHFLASAATIALSFMIIRGLSFFGIIFLLAASANFQDSFLWLKGRLRPFNKVLAAVFAGLVFLLIFPGWEALTKYKEFGIGLSPYESQSAMFFKEQGLTGPIFNNADIGSYLIYYLYPQEQVFFDNRFADAYSASFGKAYLAMLADSRKWQEALAKYDFNAIFTYHYDASSTHRSFLWERMKDPDWALVYADPFAVILVRNIPKNQEIIKKFQITKKNIGEQLEYLAKSSKMNDQIAAADLFNLMGRDDLAGNQFLKVVKKWPNQGKVWMILGQMALSYETEKSRQFAVQFLEQAIAEGHKTAEAYSLLGEAYSRTNQLDKAGEALRKSLKINPDRQDAQNLLQRLNAEAL